MKHDFIITNYIKMITDTCNRIDHSEIVAIYDVLVKANAAGGKIYLCGNGGSAATASHFQSDLNKAFSIAAKTMPAICLTDNLATLTATANDVAYEDVFRNQLQYLLKSDDVLIAISGSGNSENVCRAAEFAKKNGNTTIAVVGYDGGALKKLSDFVFHAKVDNMQVSEDIHMLFCHLVATMIRERA